MVPFESKRMSELRVYRHGNLLLEVVVVVAHGPELNPILELNGEHGRIDVHTVSKLSSSTSMETNTEEQCASRA